MIARVDDWARVMKAKIEARRYHGDWNQNTRQELVEHLNQELKELFTEVTSDNFNAEASLSEAADVANLAFMIVENRIAQGKA